MLHFSALQRWEIYYALSHSRCRPSMNARHTSISHVSTSAGSILLKQVVDQVLATSVDWADFPNLYVPTRGLSVKGGDFRAKMRGRLPNVIEKSGLFLDHIQP